MPKKLKLLSLFSGGGMFDIAAERVGITTVALSEIEPFPIAVTRKHFPNAVQLGDINKIDGAKIEPVDIVTAGVCCFPAGTLVLTDTGYRPIETIRVGDIVLTHTGNWRKVTAVGSREAETLLLKGNADLETTAEHPIYSADIKHYYPHNGGKRGNVKQLKDVGQWTEAKNMYGKQWATPREVPPLPIPIPTANKNEKALPELTAEFFYFLGRWLGDDWVNNSQRSDRPLGQTAGHICLCDSADKEIEIESAVSAITENYSLSQRNGVSCVTFSSVVLARWLSEQFGEGASNKHFPAWVFGLQLEFREEIMRGIADSDGHKHGKNIKVTTVSKKLVYGLRLLAEGLGYSTSINLFKRPKRTVIEGRVVNQSDTYTIAMVKSPRNTNMPLGLHTWYKCRAVKPTAETKTVYNMTVDTDNSYIADGIVVHNCQDVSVAGKRTGLHGERTGLFFQFTRIVREMMNATDGAFPRYLVVEEVPGLLSSNKGEDWKEFIGELSALGFICDPTILDAQKFNVAQRRKRIFIACINRRYYDPADFADVPNCRDKRMQRAVDAWAESLCGRGETFHGIASRPHEVQRQHLSEILERDVDERYYLTKAACLGILRRVDAKGKQIPQLLRSALEHQAGLFCCSEDGEPMTFEPGATARLRSGKYWSDIAPTLRSDPGDNFCSVCIPIDSRNAVRSGGNQGVGIGEDGDAAYTVTAEFQGALCVSNHPNDSRIGINADGVADCLTNRCGSGGGNVPMCAEPVAYGICSERSNAMNSGNPTSGVYETGTAKTLDTSAQSPCNQGGLVVIQGSVIGHENANGPAGKGYAENGTAYTLNTVDHGGAVAYEDTTYSMTTGGFAQVNADLAPNLTARDFKDAPIVNEKTPAFGIDRAAFNQGVNAAYKPQIAEESTHSLTAQGPGAVSAPLEGNGCPSYVVRRLTPSECLVLMGLPRDYCSNLGIAEPTDDDFAFWETVFAAIGKKKSRKQLEKWIKSPYSDGACYKLAGNGLVTNVAEFVLRGITEVAHK